ncbi:unnamed protein product [Rhodiola kirilowii]
MNNNDSIASSDHQRQLHLQSVKSRRHNSREVTSRYLSPNATGNPSPNSSVSPVRHSRKLRISSDDTTTNRGGLWPASVASNSSTGSKQVEQTTLAEHLGNLSLKDLLDESQNVSQFLNRQKSCSESISRFESSRSSKENYKPVFKSSSSNFKSVEPSGILPGRFSVDENALNRSRKSSNSFISNRLESESDQFSYKCASNDSQSSAAGVRKTASFSSYMSSTATSRRNGIHVSSKFMHDSNSTTNRLSDASVSKPVSLEDSPKLHNSILKSAMRRANSLTGYGSVTSQWALSPGRSNSSKGKLLKTYSNLKPPTSPQKSANGVEKLLNMGKDLFKTKKSSTSLVLSAASGSANAEGVHQLRLLHCRLMQWRFTNVKAETACVNVTRQAEMNLIFVQESLVRLQHSVTRRRLKFQRESLIWKLNVILHSQMKLLESWGEIERQHTSAVSKTKDSLLAAVCKVPLIEGAEVDTQLASLTLRHASDLTASMKSILTTFSPLAGETCMLLSELAEVVTHENFHIQECLEICKTISVLEVQERSLKSNLIQLVSSQQQFMQQKQPECIF